MPDVRAQTSDERTARVKSYVKSALRVIGLEVHRATQAPPLPPLREDPVDVVRGRNSHEDVALNCPLAGCVVYNGLSFATSLWHPWVQAAREYLAGAQRSYEGSSLQKYYSTWQPQDALEALAGHLSGPESLRRYPAFTYPAPWLDRTFDERAAFMARIIEIENASYGRRALGPGDGYGLHGPVSNEKGRLEYGRLIETVESIRRHGYDRAKGDISVEVLHRAGEFRYVVTHGLHRAAAMAALGHETIPAVPVRIVESAYSAHWPGVYRNIWSREEADAYFNHLFDFDSLKWGDGLGLCHFSRALTHLGE